MLGEFDEETQRNLRSWVEGNYDEGTKQEIRRMLKENPTEISDAFYSRLSFSTGGLRGLIGVGTNRMNSYTVGTCIQGFCNYLNGQLPSEKEHSVLIGYDSRHHSREFAEYTARILAANGIKALLFKELRPTPLVSFGCRLKRCSAGIMFTASHNPPQYNGCKIFWSDGAQVLAPHDSGMITEIDAIDDFTLVKSVTSLSHALIEEIGEEVDDAYYETISRLQNYREDNQSEGHTLKVVYTSLHGTGITVAPKALARWGFTNVSLVEKQVLVDGDFPTAPSPNPEEPVALALGIEKLKEVKGDLLIANDPDADRVGVAVMHRGSVEILNGNQIAALLLGHICESLTSRNKMPANAVFMKSIPTSELFTAITNYYQKSCFNVLPGFKYMAEKIRLWEESKERQFIFGAEESHGYMLGTYARDKDAICISALICEMALQAKLKGKTLVDLLHILYLDYGVYYDFTTSLAFPDSKEGKWQAMRCMQLLERRPPKKIHEQDVLIFEDYKRSVRVDFKTHQSEPLLFPKSNLLVFWLSDGSRLIIRPSGTEPKIKIYCEVVLKKPSTIQAGMIQCKQHAKDLVAALQALLAEDDFF